MKRTFKKATVRTWIVLGVSLAAIWLALMLVDASRVMMQHVSPIFCVTAAQTNDSKAYAGLGYSFDVKGMTSNASGNEAHRYSKFLLLGHSVMTSYSGVGFTLGDG